MIPLKNHSLKTKNRAYRTSLLENIFDIALNPDEVWLARTVEDLGNGIKALDNYVFIRHYKDQSIAVAGKVKGDKLLFSTWFPVRDKKVREGLLIKSRR